MGQNQSKQVDEGGDFVSISGDTRACYDLSVLRYTSHQSQTIVSLSLQQKSHVLMKRELSEPSQK
jgi:hypothetical protein